MELPEWCRYHGRGGEYDYNTKIPTQCQGLCAAAQKLGKNAYLCDSHAQDPSRVIFVAVAHFPSDICDPTRPFRLNKRGSLKIVP